MCFCAHIELRVKLSGAGIMVLFNCEGDRVKLINQLLIDQLCQ